MRRPGFWPGLFFLSTFNSIELSETKMPALADLFFGVQVVYFLLFMVFGVMFFGCEGLDMQVCWIFGGLGGEYCFIYLSVDKLKI